MHCYCLFTTTECLQEYRLLQARLLRSVGSCYFALGRYHDAAEAYEEATKVK